MVDWREDVTTKILATMRYVYDGVKSDTPLKDEEWLGESEGRYGGVKDYIISLFYALRKKAYKAGYLAGAKAVMAVTTFPAETLTIFSEEENQVGAERSYLTWEKDNK